MPFSPLVLGTVQLGLPYGIANKKGQPDQSLSTAIVREAWNKGIEEFDTAQGYGTSESVLGTALSQIGISHKVKIISKFKPDLDIRDSNVISNSIEESITNLKVPSLYGIMLHREELLSQWNKELRKAFQKVISKGKVKKIGVSVYTPEKGIKALKTEGIDLIQVPTNILDRRFEKAGVFQLAWKLGKEVYIRSVFLQGLLLMNFKDVPQKMEFCKPIIKKIDALTQEYELTKTELCLGYIKREVPNGKVVFGAESPLYVKENVSLWDKNIPVDVISKIQFIFSDVDENILNPSLWPR